MVLRVEFIRAVRAMRAVRAVRAPVVCPICHTRCFLHTQQTRSKTLHSRGDILCVCGMGGGGGEMEGRETEKPQLHNRGTLRKHYAHINVNLEFLISISSLIFLAMAHNAVKCLLCHVYYKKIFIMYIK